MNAFYTIFGSILPGPDCRQFVLFLPSCTLQVINIVTFFGKKYKEVIRYHSEVMNMHVDICIFVWHSNTGGGGDFCCNVAKL